MAAQHEANRELNRIEHQLQFAHLRSMPRYLGVVLSNRCNLGCIHCYQAKNGDNLLEPRPIGDDLRRELASLYPYLATLRLQGGELFVIPGFAELLDDVQALVRRPIVSISTNGTLIDDAWAERIVRTPFLGVTVSIDAARPETFARLRRGGRLGDVLTGIRRIQDWKARLGSEHPELDSFFVVMRSNFREIPEYVRMMREAGLAAVSLQTMQVTVENRARFPLLGEQEVIAGHAEAVELHALLRETLERERPHILIRTSGLTDLFERHGLDAAFVAEREHGLYPDSAGAAAMSHELCPNPWTTLFVTEDGDVRLCFLSEPVGNLYQEPLVTIWNSPRAVARRSRMAAGRYRESGCSTLWCDWREGTRADPPTGERRRRALAEFAELSSGIADLLSLESGGSPALAPVRRVLRDHARRRAEMEGFFQELCRLNQETNERGQAHIDALERDVERLQSELARLRQAPARLFWDKVRARIAALTRA